MIYQKIPSKLWKDPRFKNLSDSQQLFLIYVMYGPHVTSIGLYSLPAGYACEDRKMSVKKFHAWISEFVKLGFIKYCNESSLVFIRDYLQNNPIANDKHLKSAINQFQELPQSTITNDFKDTLKITQGHWNSLLYEALFG